MLPTNIVNTDYYGRQSFIPRLIKLKNTFLS